jgi:outer membrane protein assembly factor BamB
MKIIFSLFVGLLMITAIFGIIFRSPPTRKTDLPKALPLRTQHLYTPVNATAVFPSKVNLLNTLILTLKNLPGYPFSIESLNCTLQKLNSDFFDVFNFSALKFVFIPNETVKKYIQVEIKLTDDYAFMPITNFDYVKKIFEWPLIGCDSRFKVIDAIRLGQITEFDFTVNFTAQDSTYSFNLKDTLPKALEVKLKAPTYPNGTYFIRVVANVTILGIQKVFSAEEIDRPFEASFFAHSRLIGHTNDFLVFLNESVYDFLLFDRIENAINPLISGEKVSLFTIKFDKLKKGYEINLNHSMAARYNINSSILQKKAIKIIKQILEEEGKTYSIFNKVVLEYKYPFQKISPKYPAQWQKPADRKTINMENLVIGYTRYPLKIHDNVIVKIIGKFIGNQLFENNYFAIVQPRGWLQSRNLPTKTGVSTLRGNIKKKLTIRQSYLAQDLIRAAPVVGDIDFNGFMEIVFSSVDKHLYVVDYTGVPKIKYRSRGSIQASPALDDIDGDGRFEIVFGSDDNFLYVIDDNGTLEWKYKAMGSIKSAPVIADINNDGEIEIIFGSDDGFIYILKSNGTLIWRIKVGGAIRTSPGIGDINNDGMPEIIVTHNTSVFTIDPVNGSIKWATDVNNPIISSPVLGDLNFDDALDIIIGTSNGDIIALHGKGTYIFHIHLGYPSRVTPAIANLDADDDLEIVVGAKNTLFLLEANGSFKWNFSISEEIWSSPVLVDIDSDGELDIIFTSKTTLYIVSATPDTQEVLAHVPLHVRVPKLQVKIGTILTSCTVGDLDNDGYLELIFGEKISTKNGTRIFIFGGEK